MMDSATRVLLGCYDEDHRCYHGINHVLSLLDSLEFHKRLIFNHRLVYWAILAHDCVYDPQAPKGDNERASAKRWDDLNYGQAQIDKKADHELERGVKAAILATIDHVMPKEYDPRGQFSSEIPFHVRNDIAAFLSLDLIGLSSSEHVFTNNTNMIRIEYKHVSDPDFAKGRYAFFKGMLERDTIYPHPEFEAKYGNRARENMRNAMRRLEDAYTRSYFG